MPTRRLRWKSARIQHWSQSKTSPLLIDNKVRGIPPKVGIAEPLIERRNRRDSQKVPVNMVFGQLVLAGLFFAGDLSVWHWSILFTSVANSTLLANFAPIFVALGAWLAFGQRVTRSFLIAMSLALIGTSLMVGSSFQISLRHL